MKKFTLLLIICLFILPSIFADEEEFEGFNDEPKTFRIGDRAFEIGFNAGVNLSNDFLSIDEIFREVLVINIDNLNKGFKINLGVNASPFYFKVNPRHNKWGFGLFTKIDAVGAFDLNGALLSFSEASKAESDVGAAAFALVGAEGFFHIFKFKINVNPTLFYPLAYVKRNEFSYRFQNQDEGTYLEIGYDINLYTGINFSTFPNQLEITSSPGLDLSVGVEFPLAKELGISKILPFLDFDVGVNFQSIPIVPSTVRDYINVKGKLGLFDEDGNSKPIDFSSMGDDSESGFGKDFFTNKMRSTRDEEDPLPMGNENAIRPFKMIVWAAWRPLGSELLTLTPMVGFAISPQYSVELGSLEAGLKARLSLANLFILTAGICHEDRIWRNSLDMALNFHAIEFNIGVQLQSPDFLKSWGSGLGVNIGLKFGW